MTSHEAVDLGEVIGDRDVEWSEPGNTVLFSRKRKRANKHLELQFAGPKVRRRLLSERGRTSLLCQTREEKGFTM